MRKITDFQTINKKAKISAWFTAAGFVLLIGSLFIGYQGARMYLALVATIASFIVVLIGTNLAKKFTGRPRPDELISKALKGLSNDYILYNYITPLDHLLVGPKGLWIFNPKRSRGTFTYDEKRNTYRHIGGGILVQYLKLFNLEGIGNPVKDHKKDIKKIKTFLNKTLGQSNFPIHHITVIVDEQSEVNCENAPVPTLHIKALRDYLTQAIQNEPETLTPQQVAAIQSLFAEQATQAKAYAKQHGEN